MMTDAPAAAAADFSAVKLQQGGDQQASCGRLNMVQQPSLRACVVGSG